MNKQPQISVVVVVFKMSAQAARTLHSLSAAYQQGMAAEDYEVIVIENRSSDLLGEERVRAFGPNFRYLLRDETGCSPSAAMNIGVEMSRSDSLGIMIDGARMVTPGLLQYARMAFQISADPVVSVPNYEISLPGRVYSTEPAENRAHDDQLLDSIKWPSDGYRLFDIGTLNGACVRGIFRFFTESNALFCSKKSYLEIGGCSEDFNLPGGGMVNLDLYRKLLNLGQITHFLLAGEGSFHQFHGGVTTRLKDEQWDQQIDEFKKQYHQLHGDDYRVIRKNPIVLGCFNPAVFPVAQSSAQNASQFYLRTRGTAEIKKF